jgi:hypothetical protein
LRDFYEANGFALFGNAFAQYISSKNSISSTLNFTSGTTPNELYYGDRPFVLKDSEYFRRLKKMGYNIFVYQSTYMDYCAQLDVFIDRCDTYRYDGTDWMSEIRLDHFQEFQVLFTMYLQRSNIFEKIVKIYLKLNRLLNAVNLSLPPIMEWNGSTASLNSITAFRRFVGEVSRGPGGTVYFAHILLPHGPYAFDRDCQIRPWPFDWAINLPLHSKQNTQASREFRYELYFEQMRCTLKILELLFDELRSTGKFADATIIVHGDHGSRIYMNQLKMENFETLTTSDYFDGFSTLFAVRRPGLAADYQTSAVTLPQLLDHFSTNGTDRPSEQLPLHVYLEGLEDRTWVEVPMPTTTHAE